MADSPITTWTRRVAPALWCIAVAACSDARYLAHVANGQIALLTARERIDTLIAAPTTAADLARRLRIAQEARKFAITQLHLPDNRSFTTYVDVHRAYVAWNVFATPSHALDAVQSCFPIAGCVAYRGYFDAAMAQQQAAQLRARGDDVFVGGIAAYSTLGWFADPIVSSMLRWDDHELVGTIFHELAHQLIYVRDDTAFNESFASFVQQEGLRQWRSGQGQALIEAGTFDADAAFEQLVVELRNTLSRAYAQASSEDAKEAIKQQQFAQFRLRYRQLRDARFPTDHSRDAWVDAPANNARLLPYGLYGRWTHAFAALFAASDRQWISFYARVRALAQLPQPARAAALRALSDTGHERF